MSKIITDRGLKQYLKEIRRYAVLSKEEEFKLAKKIRKKNDKDAKEKMICSNLRIVVFFAKKFQNLGLTLSELINAGNEGLIHSTSKFDERKGYRFNTYSVWWIKKTIYDAINARRGIVPKSYLAKRIHAQTLKFLHKKGKEPTIKELAEILKVDESAVSLAQAELLPAYSLDSIYEYLVQDMTVDEEDLAFEAEHFEFEHDEHLISPAMDKIHMKKNQKEKLLKALKKLEPREQEILKRIFGLGDYEVHSLEEIGRILHLTRERVRQIKKDALRNLKTIISFRRKRMKK